jgi:hypothetical protein
MRYVGAWARSCAGCLEVPIRTVEWDDYGLGDAANYEGVDVWCGGNDLCFLLGRRPEDDADVLGAGDVGVYGARRSEAGWVMELNAWAKEAVRHGADPGKKREDGERERGGTE